MRGKLSEKRWGDSLRQLEFDVMDNGVVTIPVNAVATDGGVDLPGTTRVSASVDL